MKLKKINFLLLATVLAVLVLLNNCQTHSSKNMKEVKIVPQPVNIKQEKGAFTMDANTKIICSENINSTGRLFSKQIEQLSSIKPTIINDDDKNAIILKINPEIQKEEGYKLIVTPQQVTISGKTPQGIFYGTQTFLQLLPQDGKPKETVQIPSVTIEDHPRFQWRGMHLDVSRHFFDADYVKSMIDQMARLKMNSFHWHLVDDQGWRIEIKKYPKLTEIGAWRKGTGKAPWNYSAEPAQKGKPKYGGYYTQEEIKEIVDYAAQRFINIVPEIEMPGHATSMIFAYPELSCKGKPWSMDDDESFEFSDPLCAGNEKTFEVLEGVLSEVIELFPSKYIHIGGDECKKAPWAKCPKCQKRMEEEELESLEELQSYFIKRIEKFVVSKGRRIIGWDEILEGGLAPEAAVMSWRGYVGGIEAAEQGHEVVMSPTSHCYFDYYQGNSMEEPKAIGGYLPLSKVYKFDPIPPELPADKHHLILGGQGNIWTEYMYEPEHVEYMTYPRILAMAEVLWTPKDKQNYKDFLARITNQYVRLAAQGINFRMPTPEGLGNNIVVEKDTVIEIINPVADPDAKIRYTLDGTNPDNNSPIYEKPLKITETTCIKAKLFFGGETSNTALAWVYKIDPEINGLNCEYFEGEWIMLPDFNALQPLEQYKVDNFTAKSPTGKKDDYALRFSGKLLINEAGDYNFYTSSDDGSRLLINGEQIVDNDGRHGASPVIGKTNLKKGKHDIVVLYFESKGGEALEVGTVKPSGERIPIDPAKLFFE